jgi:hypothetical protein
MRKLLETEEKCDSLSREIVDENHRYEYLKSSLQRLLNCSRTKPGMSRPIIRMLEEFRDELAMRFALEIASETFKDALVDAPRLSKKAEDLIHDQELLYTEICEIAELLIQSKEEGSEFLPEAIFDRWKLLNKRLQQHDAAERNLIYEAMFLDIGVGD